MSNEEMAAAIQAGNRALLMDLWAGVRRFALKMAERWVLPWVTLEDLQQVAFLAMLEALESFSEGKGKFITWYGLRLKAAFTAATGYRTKREELDPLRSAESLDAPASEDGASLLGELIPDPAAEKAIEAVAERDRKERIQAAVKAAIDSLPEHLRAEIVSRYWLNQPQDNIAHAAALRLLRHPSRSRALRAAYY